MVLYYAGMSADGLAENDRWVEAHKKSPPGVISSELSTV